MAGQNETILQQRIRARLKMLHRSAQGAAKRAGLDKDYVRNILRGISQNPQVGMLRQLAEKGLDLTLEELTGEAQPNTGATDRLY